MEKILVASQEKKQKIFLVNSVKRFLPRYLLGTIGELLNAYDAINFEKTLKKIIPYRIIDYNNIPSSMKFPLNHPIDGNLYLSSVVDDTVFYPLSEYHEKLKQEKLNDFIKLCASLGAKRCSASSEESIERNTNVNAGVSVYNGNNGSGSFGSHNKSTALCDFSYEFPESHKISEYESPWIAGEPSWRTMKELRIQKGVLKFNAKFSYTDDFGINADFNASVQKVGINAGVTFNSIKKESVTFDVEFYPVS